jgi:hypothetical protein
MKQGTDHSVETLCTFDNSYKTEILRNTKHTPLHSNSFARAAHGPTLAIYRLCDEADM